MKMTGQKFLVIRICQMDEEEGNLVPQTTDFSQEKQQNDKKKSSY